jgi:hypothetical protein
VWPRGLPLIPSNDDPSESRALPSIEQNSDASRSTTLAIAILSVFVVVLFHQIIFGRVLFWLDTHLTFEPLFGQLGDGLNTCRLLWSPLLETGKPILANPTQAALYPPNLLFALLSASRTISILTLIHVLIGSVGTFLLARRLDLHSNAALVSGLLFAGAGGTLSATPYVGLSWCTAWLPWLLLFCDRVARGEQRLRSTVLLGLTVFMMLTIAEPMILMAAILGVAFWLFESWFRGEGLRTERLRDSVFPPVAAAAAAVVVLSPYLLAIALNLPDSVRALGFTWDGVTIWSLHPIRLFECLAPGVFGSLGSTEGGAFWAFATVPIKGFPYFPSLYLGAAALALLAAGVLGRSARRTSLTLWLTVLILLALGRWGPFYPWLEVAPGFDSARYPVKWLIPAIVPASLLAGMGMKHVLIRQSARSRRVFLLTLSSFVVLLVATAAAVHFLWFTQPLEIIAMGDDVSFSPENREVVIVACIHGTISAVAAMVLLAVVRIRQVSSPISALALSLLVAVDLIAANIGLVATTDIEFYRQEPEVIRVIRSDPEGFLRIRIDENASNAIRWAAGNPTLEEISRFQKEILAGYVAARHGVPSALTRDTEATGPSRVYFLKVLGESAPPREQAMVYGSASITHLVTDREIGEPVFRHLSSVPTLAGTSIHVYRNSLAVPRAHFAPVVIPYSGDDGYRRVVGGSSPDLFSAAVLVDSEDLAQAPDEFRALVPRAGQQPPELTASASIVEDEGHRLTIRAETSAPAVLVVNDAHLPQWSARVDGVDVPLLRVNYCFRGIHLAGGNHTVVMEYDPWRR